MRRRLFRLEPVLRWIAHNLSNAWHELPTALFLACALSSLGPDFLRDTDTLLMRGVYFFDLKFASVFEQAMFKVQTDPVADPLQRRPEVSIVSLTPAAFSNYLLRSTPVPRARLACLLYAWSLALPNPAINRVRPPVLGIDIDITPPESAASAVASVWEPVGDELHCHEAMAQALREDRPTVVEALAWAVSVLAMNHCVVAIGFPHPAGTDSSIRNAFLKAARTDESGPKDCGGVQFASPDLAQIPHEYVSEYPARRLDVDRLPPKALAALGRERFATLPHESCSLGRVMGARMQFLRNPDRADIPCLSPDPLQVLQAVEPVAYEARPIRLGPARSYIAYSSVEPAKRPFEGDLLADATRAFQATLQPSDLFVLTADSGTGNDMFMVPVVERPVPGAWVHAAIALTEFDRARPQVDSVWRKAWHFVSPFVPHRVLHDVWHFAAHVCLDLVWAFFFVLASEILLRRLRSLLNEVGREIAVAVAPAALLTAFVVLAVHLDAESLAAGEWQPHLLILLGMALHTYLDLASHAAPLAGGTGHRQADPVRVCAQLVWAVALWVFILLGMRPELRGNAWLTVAAALGCGAIHCLAAHRWHAVPLPWRLHAAHPATFSHLG